MFRNCHDSRGRDHGTERPTVYAIGADVLYGLLNTQMMDQHMYWAGFERETFQSAISFRNLSGSELRIRPNSQFWNGDFSRYCVYEISVSAGYDMLWKENVKLGPDVKNVISISIPAQALDSLGKLLSRLAETSERYRLFLNEKERLDPLLERLNAVIDKAENLGLVKRGHGQGSMTTFSWEGADVVVSGERLSLEVEGHVVWSSVRLYPNSGIPERLGGGWADVSGTVKGAVTRFVMAADLWLDEQKQAKDAAQLALKTAQQSEAERRLNAFAARWSSHTA